MYTILLQVNTRINPSQSIVGNVRVEKTDSFVDLDAGFGFPGEFILVFGRTSLRAHLLRGGT